MNTTQHNLVLHKHLKTGLKLVCGSEYPYAVVKSALKSFNDSGHGVVRVADQWQAVDTEN